jgi:hypothetical protein
VEHFQFVSPCFVHKKIFCFCCSNQTLTDSIMPA